jgi:hypothetical protein
MISDNLELSDVFGFLKGIILFAELVKNVS